MVYLLGSLFARLLVPRFLRKFSRRENFIQKGNTLIYAGREEDNKSFSVLSDRLTLGSTFADGAGLLLIGLFMEGFLLWFIITFNWFYAVFLIMDLPITVVGLRIIIAVNKDRKAPLKTEEGIITKIFHPKPKRLLDHFFGFFPPGPVVQLQKGPEISIHGISDKLHVGNHIRISYTPDLRYWRQVEIF